MTLLYTPSGARLKCVSDRSTSQHLILIPGGLGMGSEYLQGLADGISAPVSIWLVDLPGNGNHQGGG